GARRPATAKERGGPPAAPAPPSPASPPAPAAAAHSARRAALPRPRCRAGNAAAGNGPKLLRPVRAWSIEVLPRWSSRTPPPKREGGFRGAVRHLDEPFSTHGDARRACAAGVA